MEVATQLNQYNTDVANYIEVAQDILNEVLRCRYISNGIKSIEIQLDIIWRAAIQINTRLDRVLTRGGDRKITCLDADYQFSHTLIFESKQPKKLSFQILNLQNKLVFQPTMYANWATKVWYTFNWLTRVALNLIRHFITVETRTGNCVNLKTFQDLLKIDYNDSDQVCWAAKEIWALKQKNQTFSTYLTSCRYILEDLH